MLCQGKMHTNRKGNRISGSLSVIHSSFYYCKIWGLAAEHTSDNDVVADFPGEIFKIERIIPFSSKEIKQFKNQYKQINVAARNFIMSADELRRKLNVKDGGNRRVIGCTMSDDSRVLLVVNRV